MPINQVHVFNLPRAEVQMDLIRRAKAAWFKGALPGAPDDTSALVLHKGRGYVVLRQMKTVLTVYRIRSDNIILRQMKRPPKCLLC